MYLVTLVAFKRKSLHAGH